MNMVFNSIITLGAGIALGMVFYGGLWFTTKKIMQTKMPALLLFGSFILRAAITMTGFYFVTGANWKNMLICLFGFVAARSFVKNLTRPKTEQLDLSIKKSNEAKS
jgi:F1F0 ATPase subunit 2